MNSLKKIFAGLLALSMTLPVAAFSDATGDNYVSTLAEKGIIKGYSENVFGADDPCTREQLVTFLWRACGEPENENENSFADMADDTYYSDAVLWANSNGIIKGFEDGTIGINAPVDRAHLVDFLYEWAKLNGKGKHEKSIYLANYNDGKTIKPYAMEAFTWAVSHELIEIKDNNLEPDTVVTRAQAAYALGKLLEKHFHNWENYKDNGDGTHTRVCSLDASHKETKEHNWSGELTTPATEEKEGEITYTCADCLLTKTEETPFGTEITTRADVEEAVVNVGLAYYTKGPRYQYDNVNFSNLGREVGGVMRSTLTTPPEYATEDSNFYTVCSHLPLTSYFEAAGIKAMCGNKCYPQILDSLFLAMTAENQIYDEYDCTWVNQSLDDKDIDGCIARWINDTTVTASVTRVWAGMGIQNSTAFTDYTTGIVMKNDGFDGELKFGYYDSQGNKLSAEQVRQEYFVPFMENFKENLRPGDIYVDQGHTVFYIGNGKIIHSTTSNYNGGAKGGKFDMNEGIDTLEVDGAVWLTDLLPQCGEKDTHAQILRPLDLLAKDFDGDPANDIVKDVTIPEKTKSRIEYPMMDIDRTVSITPYGTIAQNDLLQYTIKIANKTNDEHYLTWGERYNMGEVTYKNLVVTEKIPEGTEYADGSATNGGAFKDGVITWNLDDIKPGETATLSFKVKAIGEIGSIIKNDGGMVSNIPSNIIYSTIGNAKLTEEQKAELSKISAAGPEWLRAFGNDTDFAEGVYKEIGKELTLPTASELAAELFTSTLQMPETTEEYGLLSIDFKPMNLFTLNNEASPHRTMLVDRFWGGRLFYVGEDRKWDYAQKAILEFREEYLEVGDIIVYARAKDREQPTLSHEFDVLTVMVYDGNNLLSVTNNQGEITYEIFDDVVAQLNKAFMKDKDLFFALRPSQKR